MRCELVLQLFTLYRLFAAGALEVGKGDAQGAPLVTQELLEAFCVVGVTAFNHHARLLT